MKSTLRRRRHRLRLTGLSLVLAVLASPLAAPRLVLGNSLTPLSQPNKLCSSACSGSGSGSLIGGGFSYDADTQRCLFGGGGCDLRYQ
jgi:hypothetical protein